MPSTCYFSRKPPTRTAIKPHFILLKEPLRAAGVATYNRFNSKDAGPDELGVVNALRSRLGKFLARFNGVSTRRLQLYRGWFEWEEKARHSDASRTSMLSAQTANGRYSIRWRALFRAPRLFWGYWGGIARHRRRVPLATGGHIRDGLTENF